MSISTFRYWKGWPMPTSAVYWFGLTEGKDIVYVVVALNC